MKIAFSTVDFRGLRTAPDCVASVEQTATMLSNLGHDVVPDTPAVDGQVMAEAFLTVWEALAESIFQIILTEAGQTSRGRVLKRILGDWRTMRLIAWIDKRKAGRDSFEPFTWRLAERSRRGTPAQLQAAMTELQRVSHQMGEFLGRYDSFVTPVLGSPPLQLGEIEQDAEWETLTDQLVTYVAFTPIANFTGLPAMSVPLHWSTAGLPIGVHFTGPYGDERRMFSLAGQLERAMPWFDKRPSIR